MIGKDAAPLSHGAVRGYYVAVSIVEFPLRQGYAGIRTVAAHGILRRCAGKYAYLVVVDVYQHNQLAISG